ncbi:erythroid membrane-associated protein-like isoform X2 [Brienomyrus brachyistius]|uniref:erythroid membrane-associated protein-like isoform X2 n=1 Tax=Brienomyrus brachyistius TaxID=42636 RepID=UPI0020B3D5A3|nr:erythroid membrane-associated protein-like isoform X2 [Brienomyrus brachyistius]
MDNIYENMELNLTTDHSQHSVNLSGSGKQFTPARKISAQPDHVIQKSDLQNQLKDLQRMTSNNISEMQAQLEDKDKQLESKNRENSNLIQQRSDLQNEVKELHTIAEDGFAKWSYKQGIVRQEVWKWIRKAAANVILDPRTAHRNLTVSEDGKQVRFNDHLLPDGPLRFSNWYGIQGKESFSSGRHYYEVQVGAKTCYVVGFAKESVKRKEKFNKTSEEGFWTFKRQTGYEVSTTPPSSLSLNEPPNKVGIYVDYDRGQISFYNVGTRSHIYSFTGYNFSDKLYPAFNPCKSLTIPLIISPVKHTD